MCRAALCTALVCLLCAACGGAGSTSVDRTSPAAGGGYLAWTSGNRRFAQTATEEGTVDVRRGGTTFRVNPPGTDGVTGGIDAGRLVYQEVDAHGSHLRLFDLASRRLLPVPPIRGIVWKPTLSGRYVLFGRIGSGWDILLADLRTGRTTVLESNHEHAGYAAPGQIAGAYAVWLSCAEVECSVQEYDVKTGRRVRVPIPGVSRRGVDGPSVAPDGTVYFGQGGLSCGSDVAIYRYRPGKGIAKVASLPRGIDYQYSYAEPVRGGVRVLFDRYDCKRKRFEIASVLDR